MARGPTPMRSVSKARTGSRGGRGHVAPISTTDTDAATLSVLSRRDARPLTPQEQRALLEAVGAAPGVGDPFASQYAETGPVKSIPGTSSGGGASSASGASGAGSGGGDGPGFGTGGALGPGGAPGSIPGPGSGPPQDDTLNPPLAAPSLLSRPTAVGGGPNPLEPTNKARLEPVASTSGGWVALVLRGPAVIAPRESVSRYTLLAHPQHPVDDLSLALRSRGNAVMHVPNGGLWYFKLDARHGTTAPAVEFNVHDASSPIVASRWLQQLEGAARINEVAPVECPAGVSTLILAENPYRTALRIVNNSTSLIVIGFDVAPSYANGPPIAVQGQLILSGFSVEWSGPTLWLGAVYCYTAGASSTKPSVIEWID